MTADVVALVEFVQETKNVRSGFVLINVMIFVRKLSVAHIRDVLAAIVVVIIIALQTTAVFPFLALKNVKRLNVAHGAVVIVVNVYIQNIVTRTINALAKAAMISA